MTLWSSVLFLVSSTFLVSAEFANLANNVDYFANFTSCLEDSKLNLTTFAAATRALVNDTEACPGIGQISQGDWTIFAPNDDALAAANFSAHTLPSVLCYHFVRGNFDATNVLNATILETGIFPNVTVGRSLLNDSSYVHLEANKSQALVWTYYKDKVVMLNQASNVTVANTTTCGTTIVNSIDSVLGIPPKLDRLFSMNFTQQGVALETEKADWTSPNYHPVITNLAGFLTENKIPRRLANGSDVNITFADYLTNHTHGFTLFAPTNEAFVQAGNLINKCAKTEGAYHRLLNNHLIKGKSVYSPSLKVGQTFTSGGGEPFTFQKNTSGLFILEGQNASAKILKTDMLLWNGVVHLLGNVLTDVTNNSEAATIAYSSAVEQALADPTDSGAVGIPTSTPVPPGQTQKYDSGASSLWDHATWINSGVGLGLAVLCGLVGWVGLGAYLV